jgi:CBS domain containing-hemolysin-like protein
MLMETIWPALALSPVLLVLLALSAFFSTSEAAFFSLPANYNRKLSDHSSSDRRILSLLGNPNRLLTAILFWNLTNNMAYFAVASVIAQKLANTPNGATTSSIFTVLSLVLLIAGGELAPKSLGVIHPPFFSRLVSFPLSIAVKLTDPITPILRFFNEASRRLIWPGLKTENYLEIQDLERAILLSTTDSQLVDQEQGVLQNILQLSEIRVDEWMRPKSDFESLPAPVSLRDLIELDKKTPYILVTDPSGNEILGTLALNLLAWRDASDLANQQQSVFYVPWCASIASILERFLDEERRLGVVVNEYGETIGVITMEDIMEAAFDLQHRSSERSLARPDIQPLSENQWQVTGITSLRRLERAIGMKLPPSRSLNIAGVLQDHLHRLAMPGDQCTWQWAHLEVIQSSSRGEMLVHLTLAHPQEDHP